MNVPEQLETERLKFRELTMLDASNMLAFFSDDETMRYMPAKRDLDGVHEWLSLAQESYERHGYGPWALMHKFSKQFLGYCGLYLQMDVNGRDEVELLYGILRQHWGQGYATEAALAVLNTARSQFQIKRLISLIEPNNTASIRVAEKTGLTLGSSTSRWERTYHLFQWD